jgi:hypothetical protein
MISSTKTGKAFYKGRGGPGDLINAGTIHRQAQKQNVTPDLRQTCEL